MQRAIYVPTLLLGIVLLGCSSADDAADDTDRETVFDPLVDTLEQAEQVEDMALQKKEQMDEALRRLEGEEDTPER